MQLERLIALISLAGLAVVGCSNVDEWSGMKRRKETTPVTQTDDGALVADYLATLDRLGRGGAAQQAEIIESTRGAYLDQKTRNRLVNALKGWPLGKVRHVPLERGEVVAGGIPLDEVDSQTMRSRLLPGLYLCGEVLDIAGPVGGYNLQAAWSTGYVAGETAAQDWQQAVGARQ